MNIYRPLENQVNEFVSFGSMLLLMGFVTGFARSVITDTLKPEEKYLPMTDTKKRQVTVICPICGETVFIPDYGTVTRTDALKLHIIKAHSSSVDFHAQLLVSDDAQPLPAAYRDLSGFLRDPLPGYSLMTLLPTIDIETGEKKIDAVMKQLKAGVEGIQDSYPFRMFLTTMSKFHDYSIGNQILIMLQKPEATRVAGFNTWKDLGRWVKKEEKGIAILAPVMPAKQKANCPGCGAEVSRKARFCPECGQGLDAVAGGEFEQPRYFRVVHVFDIGQTEGEPLPEFDVPVLTGEANEELFPKFLGLMKTSGIRVSFEPRPELSPGIKGQYSPGEIWIRPQEPRAQQLKSLLHEIAHYYSDNVFRIPRQDAETIAESAAYVVGAHYGFDTGVRSFPYVAIWARDKKVLENNLGSIRKVSTTIIEGLQK